MTHLFGLKSKSIILTIVARIKGTIINQATDAVNSHWYVDQDNAIVSKHEANNTISYSFFSLFGSVAASNAPMPLTEIKAAPRFLNQAIFSNVAPSKFA